MKVWNYLIISVMLFLSLFVFAVDGDGNDNNVIPCTSEGNSMPVVPGYACCEGLSAIQPTAALTNSGTCEPLTGSSLCSKCGNGTCEQWENSCNCAKDCAAPSEPVNSCVCTMDWNPVCGVNGKTYANKCGANCAGVEVSYVGECIQAAEVKEQVKCLFNNSIERQKCNSYFNNQYFSCSTEESASNEACVADVSAPKGTKLVWKSSCGGYAYTLVDGENEYAKFDCQTTEPVVPCSCTKEYAPVCATIKVCATNCVTNEISSNDVSTCGEICGEEKRTFSNSCQAKCAGAEIVREGACEQTCPDYAEPLCAPGSKIVVVYDSRGCKKTTCVTPEAEHYSGAYWECSNGKEFKEADACMPAASWKEKARQTCVQYSSKCAATSEQSSSATGNFILDVVGAATSAIAPTQSSTETTKCIGGEVYVTDFQLFGACSPNENSCKYYVDEQGCKVKTCIDGTTNKACPTKPPIQINTYRNAYWQCYSGKEAYSGGESSCKTTDMWKQYASSACENECSEIEQNSCENDSNTCSTAKCGVSSFKIWNSCYDGNTTICSKQSDDELRAMKEKCSKNNGGVIVELTTDGCRDYKCSLDSTSTCNSVNDLPAEKKIICEERGGQLITKSDDKGCLVYLECIGEKINDSNASINKELISDKMKLLNLAIKLETAKMELEKTAAKLREIASYYEGTGKAEDANRFYLAANILEASVAKLDEIKQEIKDNVDNFGEERAMRIREMIRNIKEDLLKEALLAMLG